MNLEAIEKEQLALLEELKACRISPLDARKINTPVINQLRQELLARSRAKSFVDVNALSRPATQKGRQNG